MQFTAGGSGRCRRLLREVQQQRRFCEEAPQGLRLYAGTGGRGTEGSVQHEYKPAEIGEDEDEDQKTCSVGSFMGYASEAIIVRLSSHDPVQLIT